MGKFASQVAKELDSRPIDRVVLDLRFNGGGNERVINPLKNAITKHEKARGKLFVLIGARTFSSAIDNAIALKRSGATLVGEPTGGRPSSYGEVKTVTLPNSKLLVRFTTKFDNVPASLDFDELRPDVLAPLTFGEVRFGRDSGLAAAIAAK
jgi:C-terminal processing protease CtpA/Prc